jgi:hypothetical protein
MKSIPVTEVIGSVEIMSDGATVWVNGSDGGNVGRFSRSRLDIHHAVEVQVETGATCLNCRPGPTDVAAWRRFCADMRALFGVSISDRHTPEFLKVPA